MCELLAQWEPQRCRTVPKAILNVPLSPGSPLESGIKKCSGHLILKAPLWVVVRQMTPWEAEAKGRRGQEGSRVDVGVLMQRQTSQLCCLNPGRVSHPTDPIYVFVLHFSKGLSI